jgi:hypothetical protein
MAFADKLARPVLEHAATGRLAEQLPNYAGQDLAGATHDRRRYAPLEAFARLLLGLAPWLNLPRVDTAEGRNRARWAELARAGLELGTRPETAAAFSFSEGRQPLVDAALLAQALLRAPDQLWQPLPASTQTRVIDAFRLTRQIVPHKNNWVLFASMIEAFLQRQGEPVDPSRLHHGFACHRDWYLGDGVWGDGPAFRWDYYNSFIIQPMLIELVRILDAPEWRSFGETLAARSARFSVIQERMIGRDGSFPPIGRSLTYRCGAFHLLAQAALLDQLPSGLPRGRVRRALSLVIQRTLGAPGTFDDAGWLKPGLAGHQPSLAEGYISAGSLYFCSTALLPLGLPETHPFWTDAEQPTTSELAWSGADLPADHALHD